MLQDNIKIIRKNKGYSQEELASKLHVTRQTISKWETGQSVPDANLLKQLSVIFDVSVSELMDGNAERILENEVIVEQLSRVNENLVLAHKRFSRIVIVAVCVYVCKASIASKSSSMQLLETAWYTSLQNLYGEAVDKTIDGVLSCVCN